MLEDGGNCICGWFLQMIIDFMKIRDMRMWKYYKCGMISLIFIPVLFYIELKTNKAFVPQFGIENRYLSEPDSSAWVNGSIDYFSDYSGIKKRDSIRVLQKVDIAKIEPLFDLKSGSSLCFCFSDSACYGDYISIYNCALKHKLAIFNIDNSSLIIFNPTDNSIRVTPGTEMLDWINLEGDVLPEITLWEIFKNIARYHYYRFLEYVDLLIKIDLFYKVLSICIGYLMIVILNMIELKRMQKRHL